MFDKEYDDRFREEHEGVMVDIGVVEDRYYWISTSYGSTEQRAAALDHFHEKYNFENWEAR